MPKILSLGTTFFEVLELIGNPARSRSRRYNWRLDYTINRFDVRFISGRRSFPFYFHFTV